IQPAADIAAERHLATQSATDGPAQDGLQFLGGFVGIVVAPSRAGVGKIEIPVTVNRQSAIVNANAMAGRDGVNAFKERPPRRQTEKIEEIIDAAYIRPSIDHTGGEKAFNLGGPQQPTIRLGIKQGTDADTIAA